MNKTKALLTLLFSALGIFGANEYYKPRNIKDLLKWRGVKLSSDDKVWKSMYFEHEKELKERGIEDKDGLWKWCAEKFKVTNLNDKQSFDEAKKFCSDSATSIMGRIIREGEEHKVIDPNNKDAFKVNYLLATNQKEVLELIGFKGEQPASLKEVAELLAKWCKDQEIVNVISSSEKNKILDFKKRCYNLGVKKFSELLDKQGRKIISTEEEFETKFKENKFEYATELNNDLNKTYGNQNEQAEKIRKSTYYLQKLRKELGPDATDEAVLKRGRWMLYKRWCESKLINSLLENNGQESNIDIYSRFFSRCTVPKKN